MASELGNHPGVWRLGIHGVRGTGKTCYLAALYGFRANENGSAIGFADEETIDYLADKWDQYLAKGEKPQSTPLAMPSELRCQVKARPRMWQIVLRDYAGELVQRNGSEDAAELREEARSWLAACHAILFFLDVTESEDAIRERLNELDLLLAELHKLSAEGRTIARPLALVLTKWDSTAGFDVSRADTDAESEKARRFLKDGPVFGQFHTALEQSGDRVAVFPVSAFGSHRAGHLPPADGPRQAFNLHAPLVWSVATAEEMVAQKAERDANEMLDARWRPYGRAIEILRQALTAHRLNRGPAYVQIENRIRDLRVKLRRRWLLATAAILVVCGLVFLITGFFDEQQRYQGVVRAHDDPAAGSAGVKSLTEQYLARSNPFKLLGHERDVRSRWAKREAALSQADFDNLARFRRDHPDEAEAALRLDRDLAFVWEGGSQAPTVSGWKMEDMAAAARYQARVTHESRYQRMLEEVAALTKDNKYAEAVQACRRFLDAFPSSAYKATLEQQVAEMEAAKDDYDWKRVVDFDQKNTSSFDETIKLAGEYLSRPTAKHRGEAEGLVTRTEDRWDAALYEQVRGASRWGADANAVESVLRKATAYLSGTQPRMRMRPEVQRWRDWFNALQKEADYYVVVRSMEIPPGSDLDESNPCCKVQIALNGRSFSTDWAYGKKPVYGTTLGPYRFRWGQQGTFSVRIEEHDYDSPNDVAEFPRPDTDDRFILGRLNGPVAVRDRNGKDVTVYLECEAVTPPQLPPYKGQ